MPKAQRLRNRKDYRAVYDRGIRCYSPNLTLIALNAKQNEICASPTASMFGISISKKVSKKAVVRNRIKRQIKGIIRSQGKAIAPGWKIVIVVKPKAIECKYEHFLRELEELLKKAKIIDGH
nr:ribonuclease P protein component [Waterburya agarophytonicola]